MRILLSTICFAVLAAGVSAQDIKPEKIADVKAASVFIRFALDTHKFTGSGFVVSADGDSLLVATNAHVISPDEFAKLSPSALLAKLKRAKITILFGSGTATERSAAAEVVSLDPAADIGILKLKASDVKDPPKALKVGGAKALAETSTVYTFGYPFGDALSTGKGPAVTVGKASISSLRTDESGKLTTIQIDGNLNPGNSGGPVIDTDGAVIGVATATIRDSKGIGLAVPAAEVAAMLAGKVSILVATYAKQTDGKVKVSFEALLSDPAGTIAGVTLNYKLTDAKGEKPKDGADLSALPGAKSLAFKLDGATAKGELVLDAAAGAQLSFSARPSGAKKWEASANTHVSLGRAVLGGAGIGPDDKPPAGWKEIAMDTGLYTIWVPEKTAKQLDKSNTYRGQGLTITSTSTQTLGDNGVLYRLERASLRLTGAGSVGTKFDSAALRESISKSLADEIKGKIVEESDAKMGTWPCKEYVIKSAKETAVVRIFVSIRTVYIVQVLGPAKSVSGDDGYLFLDSFRIHPRDVVAADPNPTPPGAAGKNGETNVVGGGPFDPVFRDYAPEGGLLVGFEFGLGKWANNDVLAACRPIFRTKAGDTFGAAHGPPKEAKVVKAKEGYAVGAVTLKSGGAIDGLSITFMKIAGDKLDTADSYESEWIGGTAALKTDKLGGTGAQFLGIVGKTNNASKNFTGLGLIANTPEALEARKNAGRGVETEIIGGGFNQQIYRDYAPEGGLLVGLEIALTPADFIMGIRPIYQTGGKETTGKQTGRDIKRVVTLMAKPGYAVGAVSIISGLNCDGMTVTFMKIAKDGLDPKDSYPSEYVGTKEQKVPRTLSGEGKAVIGVVGKQTALNNSGFGLILQAEKK